MSSEEETKNRPATEEAKNDIPTTLPSDKTATDLQDRRDESASAATDATSGVK